ncbi:MAG: PmbA/TldA family metallopeptidase, partial [Candidatus Heimdallarchaeaceae archaeon]
MDSAISRGASYADIRYGRREEERVIVSDDHIQHSFRNITAGYGIRMLMNGIISFCSVPKISFASDEIDKTLRAMRLIERWSRGNSSLA